MFPQIVITEIMNNPLEFTDTHAEWFELYNNSNDVVNLEGWTIKDSTHDYHVIQHALDIEPYSYLVFARDSVQNDDLPFNYDYSSIILANSEDELILLNTTLDTVDIVKWDSEFPFSAGHSMELIDVNLDNNNNENWVESTTNMYGQYNYGTPGFGYTEPEQSNNNFEFPNTISISNYPNPFNPETNLYITNGVAGDYSIDIFDIQGKLIERIYSGYLKIGLYNVTWNASSYPSGFYLVQVVSNEKFIVHKMMLLK
jgi:hypothetical protein